MPDTETLRLLRDIINEAICRDEGHEYDDMEIATTGVGHNNFKYERCTRCGSTRTRAMDSTMSDNLRIGSVTVSGGDE